MTTHKSISETAKTSEFQKAIEVVEALPLDSQAVLIDILEKRLRVRLHEKLVEEVNEAKQEFAEGNVSRGSVADLMAELDD